MSSNANTPSRRGFLKGGALAATPFAMSAPAALADDGTAARLARLEDEKAIREAHQAWLTRINSGQADAALEGVRGLTADPKTAEVIDLGQDGKSATLTLSAVVETERELARDCTLADMAHAQGTGRYCQSEHRTVTARYRKTEKGWVITSATLA